MSALGDKTEITHHTKEVNVSWRRLPNIVESTLILDTSWVDGCVKDMDHGRRQRTNDDAMTSEL